MALPQELVDECNKLLVDAQDGERVVKTVHDVLSLLERHGHVYSIQLRPAMVGISPRNRDGSGVNPVDVHDLLGDILSAGWVDARVTAIAAEPASAEELAWNAELFQRASGLLGEVDTSQLKALSLAGSHTNCVLRCFSQEVSHTGDDQVLLNGKLSLELLRKRDAGFHKAVTEGLVWRVLSAEVAKTMPDFLTMVQRMGNATLQRGEHELQLMRRLHSMWLARTADGSEADFLDIKKRALTGKSIHGKSLPHLYSFALKFCGGRTPFLLQETETFVRTQAPSTRALGADFWSKMAQDVKGVNQFPRFRHAVASCMTCARFDSCLCLHVRAAYAQCHSH